jgi:hypothetical protein
MKILPLKSNPHPGRTKPETGVTIVYKANNFKYLYCYIRLRCSNYLNEEMKNIQHLCSTTKRTFSGRENYLKL